MQLEQLTNPAMYDILVVSRGDKTTSMSSGLTHGVVKKVAKTP
jgi:hypothetical protein